MSSLWAAEPARHQRLCPVWTARPTPGLGSSVRAAAGDGRHRPTAEPPSAVPAAERCLKLAWTAERLDRAGPQSVST